MKVEAGLVLLLLANVCLNRPCTKEGLVLICSEIQTSFDAGYSFLVMPLRDVGQINSTVFHSDNFASITRLTINDAGVTAITQAAFGSFRSLTTLNLDGNLLTQLNPNCLGAPAVLRELSLANNRITAVNESMLHGLVNLTKLRLNKNGIATLSPDSFSSQSLLADLDLSENRMTRISRQVFGPLVSTEIRLDGNPWDCSCDAEDSVVFLKELWSHVTCASPPSLRGRRVDDVSVCETSSPSGPPSVTQTVPLKPTAENVITSPPSQTTASVQPKPSEAPATMSSHTGSHVTSSSSVRETSIHPSDLPITPCRLTEAASPTRVVLTLIVVVALLCLLLVVTCFMAALRRRKRNIKTVFPGRPEEERKKLEEDRRPSGDRPPGAPESRDPETAQRRPPAGVRAKSANAIILTSPFCVSEKHQATEAEARCEDAAERERTPGGEAGARTGNFTHTADVREEREKHRGSVDTDVAPYLSIGTNQNGPGTEEESADRRSHTGGAIGRISTWPLTAGQWKARCKLREDEEEGGGFAEKFSGEVKMERPSGSDQDTKDDESERNQTQAHTNPRFFLSSGQSDQTSSVSEALKNTELKPEEQHQEEEMTRDPVTESQTQNLNQENLRPNRDLNPAENPELKSSKSSNRAGLRREAKRAGTGAENGGSAAPSGGTSPDDETLLSGNEYAFVDLLHEVVQNNGRWTRGRWKQSHGNKHGNKRQDRGTEGV